MNGNSENNHNIRFGIAPINWNNDDLPALGSGYSLERILSEMNQAGYEGTEFGNKFPNEASVLCEILDTFNLKLTSSWHSTYFVLNEQENELKNVEEKVSFLKEANAEVINIAECSGSVHSDINKSLAAKPILSDPDWELLIGSLNIAGEICNDYGIRLAYHHHMGTCIQTNEEIKRLLKFTDPNYVNLCVDTGHLYYAGIDPVEFIENNLERIVHVHFKDVRKEEFNKYDSSSDSFLKTILSGIFTVPGDGCIDFSSIVKILQQNHYNGWIIVEAEQDPDKADPLHYAISSRNYLNSISIN
tara:strand:+ start:277 stop:1182 length:906 start_codon:yes stop_codon:yes gene_type:complete